MTNKEDKNFKYQYFYDYIIKVLSIAKVGKLFSKDEYALDNYDQLQKISMECLTHFTDMKFDRSNYFSRNVYPTPNVSVRTCIFNDKNEVLLVKEKEEGKYSLPGGWCDLFTSPTEAASIECIQEAGAYVGDFELIGISNKDTFRLVNGKPVYNSIGEYQIVFRAKLVKDLVEHGFETSEVGFYSIDKLPAMSSKCSLEEWKKSINNALNRKIYCE